MNKELENSLLIFTDGSSLGNPGPGGWGAILTYPRLDEIIELGGSKIKTTNNEMELTAIISALTYALNSTSQAHIFTDSQYAINGATKWMYGWSKNGWKTKTGEDIKNKSIWQTMHSLVEEKGADTITWQHVKGHVGIPGNERVDDIARELAEGIDVQLYRGTLSDYSIKDILDLDLIENATEQAKEDKKKGGKAYLYLSLIDGVLMKHKTWPECESRVTGKKAKFKKALSEHHEQEILKEWGLTE
ncbi:MAG: ribonuclease HI [Crocinitomicaceae bacterium]|jgi:ribonuclease HI